MDVAEFAAWAAACGVDPAAAFARFLAAGTLTQTRERKRSGSGGSSRSP